MNTLVKNKFRGEAFEVYVGRPSRWGNPFSHRSGTLAQFKVATREEAVAAHKLWLWGQITSGAIKMSELAELDGKTLGCWCAPAACHAETLAAAASWAARHRTKEAA